MSTPNPAHLDDRLQLLWERIARNSRETAEMKGRLRTAEARIALLEAHPMHTGQEVDPHATPMHSPNPHR